ncbi:MAG: murein DD-endopeptidase MepM/ murein hydrolase activator NlpD [Limisphaerales bacterium]|jgi:murein DD-endopeptidase MepM/ murein hydrolase activator NlpD
MKLILVRDGGFNRAIHLPRKQLYGLLAVCTLVAVGLAVTTFQYLKRDEIDAAMVAEWRLKLTQQYETVAQIERRSTAQSAAVGRQLAQMQARLLRMEAVGAHLADSAELEGSEFDFANPPAQGGPMMGEASNMDWLELQDELSGLASRLKRREVELNILDSVLVSQDIQSTSQVRGRPVKWGWLSSPYGERVDPLTGQAAWHSGVDFAGRDGSDVIAVASGVVTFSGTRSGYGQVVEVSHAGGMVTRYAHHKELIVKTGDVVKKGDSVGLMGSSGRSTGPHVHFEVLKNGRTVDPAHYVKS